jgi:peroxiredoxin/predicted 2-oxoglutarate/Fe(II)-dependent dioxygenase YbiX
MPSAPTPRPRTQAPDFGEPAPFFTAETDGIANYSIEVAAGRWIVLMVFGSLGAEVCRLAHDKVLARRDLFNDADAAFYGVSVDMKDRFERGLANAPFGLRYFWDFDQRVCRLYGLADDKLLRPAVFLIDRGFRIAAAEPIEAVDAVLDQLENAMAAEPPLDQSPFAPVLTLPRVFEPEFCETLIDYFKAREPSESGFAAEVGGRTVELLNPHLKRRQDVTIEDPELVAGVKSKLETRLLPMVKRAFGWQATEIERYLITRYSEHDQGFFSAHRDDVTAGTAHRKFAVTLNLNTGEYDGGALRFPEFGRRTYQPPAGGATVFSCALLHEATPVTRGVRYALVPFLYDEAGAKLRRANLALVGEAQIGNRRDRRAGRRR